MINLGWIPGYLQTQGRMLHQSHTYSHFEKQEEDKVPTWKYVYASMVFLILVIIGVAYGFAIFYFIKDISLIFNS